MGGEVWLVRHGETEWSRAGRHTSSTDLDLTESGREVARGLAGRLDPTRFELVLTSPLRRAADTAALAGFADAEVEPRLREWEYGAHEGLTTEQIRAAEPGWELWTHLPAPGGESPDDVAARIGPVVRRCREIDGDVLLFAHGHSLAVVAALWLGLGVAACGHFRLDTAAVSVLGTHRQTPVLRRWNS